ncbi:hypothetical protein LZF95_06205 [Algoriphagus sp. AGSA1]|uniref:hypothetical protein n=1 Tax=Algoriphagus sp. AGSA1 TaxID=2907213 RepID=UPI001F196335|nr:hypothetical protein [Algoriphagus sp. AGSA1]MCE7054261.1 hypothetical protein [Algoriphagus sp. AGSA1]
MKNLNHLFVATAISLILFTGCEEKIDSPVIPINPDLAEVEPTPCENPPLPLWYLQQLYSWGQEASFILADTNIHIADLALMHTVYFENSAANQIFGPNGEYTEQINQQFNGLKSFWDMESDQIILVASRGSMLEDRVKVVKTYQAHYGYSDHKANVYADSIATLLQTYPQFLNGQHPAFTFNQLAIPDTILSRIGQIPDKIIIGDGLLQGYEALGYGAIAPQAILAHEFGHHIQYELGILIKGMSLIPKTARRIELMADAYAAYFLSHPMGGAMQEEGMQQVSEVFFNIGDCSFEANSHHGTPTQRKAATEWGYRAANDLRPHDQILSILEFARMFDAELENIVKQ